MKTILLLLCLSLFSCKKESNKSDSVSYVISEDKLYKIRSADRTIQIDPTFPYYLNRSVESIVDEIVQAGFKAVHYFVVNENYVNGELIKAFQERDLPVWLLTLGNGTYSTVNYPKGWEDWKMGLNASANGTSGFIFLSPFNKSFVEWKKKSLARLMTEYSFDGIELAESYFPEWDAISKGTYGDIGPNAQKAFKEQYNLEMLNFSDFNSPSYYKKHPDTYQKWVEFRVNAVNSFLDELINGKGGIREVRPDALVATWSLAIDKGQGSFDKLREDQGLDAASMITKVKPDIHFFQTHWPDWVKSESDLPPDYMKAYQVFIDQVKRVHPNVPLGIQADIGSLKNMVKSQKWVDQFEIEAKKYGYSTWTGYEYHLGGYIYTENPTPKSANRNNRNSITISFSKRIDKLSGEDLANFSFSQNKDPLSISILSVEVDGNRIKIYAESFPSTPFEVHFKDIEDTPNLWLFKGYPALKVVTGSKISID